MQINGDQRDDNIKHTGDQRGDNIKHMGDERGDGGGGVMRGDKTANKRVMRGVTRQRTSDERGDKTANTRVMRGTPRQRTNW